MEILDKLLHPAVVWILIPILPILFLGVIGIIRSLRRAGDVEEFRAELHELQARVEKLEQAQRNVHNRMPAY